MTGSFENLNAVEVAIHVGLAAMGGIVREMASNDGNKSLKKYFIEAFISIFTGIVVFFLMKEYVQSDYLTACATSMAGYLGPTLLQVLSQRFLAICKSFTPPTTPSK